MHLLLGDRAPASGRHHGPEFVAGLFSRDARQDLGDDGLVRPVAVPPFRICQIRPHPARTRRIGPVAYEAQPLIQK